ncbi:adenylyl-sulfate kinase [Ferrimonas pelagia]|uniref:Adenylyl-sulfate kinase n=1 Tax=Ferrimonas pelagia TaxID=1177826 RepID=A0ABP9EBV1_9GAMM
MSSNIVWHDQSVSHEERQKIKGHKPLVLWFTGLSGSGKSTIANAVERKLAELSVHSYLLDGDNVRHGLNKDLGFSDTDRIENIRRIGEVSNLMAEAGLVVLTAFISPFRSDRQLVRELVGAERFVEVFIDTPLEVCEQRDPKGLYKKARTGEIKHFTGIDSAYEAPQQPDIHVQTAEADIETCAERIVEALKSSFKL